MEGVWAPASTRAVSVRCPEQEGSSGIDDNLLTRLQGKIRAQAAHSLALLAVILSRFWRPSATLFLCARQRGTENKGTSLHKFSMGGGILNLINAKITFMGEGRTWRKGNSTKASSLGILERKRGNRFKEPWGPVPGQLAHRVLLAPLPALQPPDINVICLL